MQVPATGPRTVRFKYWPQRGALSDYGSGGPIGANPPSRYPTAHVNSSSHPQVSSRRTPEVWTSDFHPEGQTGVTSATSYAKTNSNALRIEIRGPPKAQEEGNVWMRTWAPRT